MRDPETFLFLYNVVIKNLGTIISFAIHIVNQITVRAAFSLLAYCISTSQFIFSVKSARQTKYHSLYPSFKFLICFSLKHHHFRLENSHPQYNTGKFRNSKIIFARLLLLSCRCKWKQHFVAYILLDRKLAERKICYGKFFFRILSV